MEPPVLAWDEQARLEALRGYEVLDTPPEPSFDDITLLAAQLCGTPIAVIALIDEERVWLKSRLGADTLQFPRDTVLCGRAAVHPALHVVPDTLTDPVVDMSEREEMRARLALADRMAAVGTLAAGVAHEINNPLAYVIANLDYARQEIEAAAAAQLPPDADELPRALREAREGAERVRLIVKDLKTFSRPDDTRLGRVDLRQAMDSAVTLAWNEIRVSTRVDEQGRVVAEVHDTGAGIPEDIRPRVLEPFFTTRPLGEGTGLGLSICHGIVLSLGGELQFDTEVGKGTTFRVILPRRAMEDGERKMEQRVEPPRRSRILAVDDEPLVLNSLRRTLGSEHELLLFTRAREALAWLEQGEPWDLILCDLMMPEMTGMEFHAELSRRMPERAGHVLFVTGGAFTAGARDFLNQITTPIVEKPFSPAALRQLIHEQLPKR